MAQGDQTIPFPNERIVYETEGNPTFITDITNTGQSLLTAMKAMYGLGDTNFAIISGFEQGYHVFSPGVFYLDGNFYYTEIDTPENYYLTPDITQDYSKVFPSDNISRYTYNLYKAVPSITPYGSCPIFNTNIVDIESYRLTFRSLKAAIDLAVTNVSTPWQTPVFSSGYSGTVSYRINNIGQLEIKGTIVTGDTVSQGTVFTLLEGFRPEGTVYFRLNYYDYFYESTIDAGGIFSLENSGIGPGRTYNVNLIILL
jgi:hypothetical protein